MGANADSDAVILETIAAGGRDIEIARPRDAAALIDEEAFVDDEFLPYWAELWPSGVALAREVLGRALRGARVLDLGAGLGTAAVAAALAGGRVLATDWSAAALEFTRANAERNDVPVETLLADWSAPEPLLERAPFDLVIAADVVYERRNIGMLIPLLPRLAREVWLADPGRAFLPDFLEAAEADWTHEARQAPDAPRVTIHRLRRREK
jgi:predicted nicotinamide N-methyase